MAGDCLVFRHKPQLHCAALGSNVHGHDWADGDRLCTKAGHLKQLLTIDALKDATARKHFAALKPGSWQSKMEAHCRAWKQAVCQGRTCRVKKNVKCLKVCRRKLATGYFVDKCSTVPNSVARPDEKLGESVRAKAVRTKIMARLGESIPITPAIQRVIDQVSDEVSRADAETCAGKAVQKQNQPSSASPAPSADTSWQGSFNLTHGK